jgi:hypothetical protein
MDFQVQGYQALEGDARLNKVIPLSNGNGKTIDTGRILTYAGEATSLTARTRCRRVWVKVWHYPLLLFIGSLDTYSYVCLIS